ncbi:MAG: hypothetical protein HY277_09620, partial [Ignavibacteriales bacterium]|nr:hypothetical protein [Ignavibacteriales bacterium]
MKATSTLCMILSLFQIGFGQTPTYQLILKNDSLINSTAYEFDIYLQRTGVTALELATLQPILTFNTGISSGTLSFTINAGSSQLNASQQPTDAKLSINGDELQIQPNLPPGAGSGTVIPIAPGLRVGRFRVSSTVPFENQPANIAWKNSGANPITKINAYVGGSNTPITDTTGHTNLLANGTLSPLTVTTNSPLPSATAGTAYAETLMATGGSPPYSWSITTGSLPTGLTLASTGIISGTTTTAGNFGVTIQATDAASGTASRAFTLTVIAGAAAELSLIQQPTSTTAGATISPAVTAQLRDAFGNNVATSGVAVAIAIASGTGVLSGTLSQLTSGSGLATFNDLSINLVGTKTLTVSSGGLTPDTSNIFTISAGTANHVVFIQQPTDAGSGVAISPAITVQLKDAFGNNVTTSGITVSMSLSSGTGTLSGTKNQNTNTSGIALFNDLSIDLAGPKTLTASSGSLTPAASNAFTITPGSATHLVFTQQPSNTVAGVAIAPAITVQLRDAAENDVPTSGIGITMSLASGTGTLSGSTLQVTDALGKATYNDLSINLVGTKTLSAVGGRFLFVVSNSFTISTAAASKLVFVQQPTNGVAGAVISPPITVQLNDSLGNTVATAGVSVSMALSAGSGSLGGTIPQLTNGSGLATFSDLVINQPGAKVVRASSGALTPATSNSFTLTMDTIIASAGPNGSIAPSGTVTLLFNANQTFTISPNAGYHIQDVLVDGSSVGAVGSYSFTNVTSNHSISASFSIDTLTITASAGANGSVIPSGAVKVPYDGSKSFTITPTTGYHVSDVLVDGSSVGAVTSFLFTNVVTDHTISASFAIDTLTITATSGGNGTISPAGNVRVLYGASQSFTITPSLGYHISDVVVDGGSVGPVSSYTFTNVTTNHTITASFTIIGYTITATAGANGTISPSGAVAANFGSSQTFTIAANTGYHIANVLVDGNSVGAVSSYTFTNIQANHTITASFAPNSLSITVQTSPPGLTMIVDGVTLSSPQSFTWTAATNHTIAVVDTQSGGVSTRYLWNNWSDNGAKSHTVTPLTDSVFSANFTTQYFLTMSSNPGGTALPPSNWFNKGQIVTIIGVPDSKYNFSVWSGTGNGSTNSTSDTATVTMNGPISEIANFVRKPVQITIQANPPGRTFVYDGAPYTVPQTRTVVPGESHSVDIFNLTQSDTMPGRQFVWKNWSDGGPKFHTISPDSNTTYIANFGSQFLLTVVAGPNGTVTPPSDSQDSAKVVAMMATPNTGYHFSVWKGKGTGSYTGTNNPANVTMGGPINDTASFAIDTLIIAATSGANGSISPAGDVKVTYGSSQTFTITPAATYHISDVVVDGNSVGAVTSYTFTNVTANHTITASFTINGYTITASAGANGTISPSGPVAVTAGSNQLFTMTPNNGYHVDSVLVDGVNQGPLAQYTFTNITANHTIRAIFAPNGLSVIVQTNPAGLQITVDGSMFVSPQTFNWLAGSSHTIAAPDSQAAGGKKRYLWLNWSDGGAKSHTVSSLKDTTFTATFTTQYFLTMTAGVGGSVTPSSDWHDAGQIVPINAIPSTGYRFTGWTGTGSGSFTGSSASASVTMNDSVIESATFGLIPIQVTVTSNPSGRSFTVDGNRYTTTQTFTWNYGETHSLATADSQSNGGTRFLFLNWSDGGLMSHSVMPISDTVFSVNFKTQYLLTMNSESGGTVLPSSNWQDSGRVVSISAQADPGYAFNGWTGTGAGSFTGITNPTNITMLAPITETASFTRFGVSVTLQTNPSGLSIIVDSISYVSPQTFSWVTGSSHTISTTSPQSGGTGTRYVWNSWSDNGTMSHVVVPLKDSTITANFTTQYYLTMIANPGGSVTPTSTWYNSGQSVTITGFPTTDYVFNVWSGSGNGSYTGNNNPATVFMNGPITEVGNFRRDQVQIVLQSNPPGRPFSYDGATYTTTQTRFVDPGTEHFLNVASPQPVGPGMQYVFNNWSDGGAQFHSIFPDSNTTYTVNFTKQFLLTVVAETGGSVSPPSGFQDSGKAIPISATANVGYTFIGWNGSGPGSYTGPNASASVTMSGPIADTARFTQFAVQVTIGSNPSGRSIIVDGVEYTSTQIFHWIQGSFHSLATSSPQTGDTLTRYLFTNWSDGGSLSHSVAPISDTTITANFSTQYYLTMNAGSGGTVTPPSNWHNAGQSVSINATPNATYTFGGWNGSGPGSYSGTNSSAVATMNGPITETSSFTLIPVHVTIGTNPAGLSYIVDSVSYSKEQTFIWEFGSRHSIGATSPQNQTSDTRDVWRSWSDSGAISHTIIPVSDTSLTASFGSQFFLTMVADTGGTVSPASNWQDSGKIVRISATANTGYTFSSWSGSGSGSYSGSNSSPNITMNGPVTERASFIRFAAQVTVRTNPSGLSITVDGTPYISPHSFTWLTGSNHTIAAVDTQSGNPGIRYLWNNWSDGKPIMHAVTPLTDSTFTANFGAQYYLTMGANDGGTATPASGWYNSSQSVTITAIPEDRYNFNLWSGTGLGSYNGTNNPATVTMNSPISQTANFTRKPVIIRIQSNPSGRSFVYDGVSYTQPQTRTVNPGEEHFLDAASPQSAGTGIQYVWKSWSDGGARFHSIFPDSSTTYTVNFGKQFFLTTVAGTGGTVTPQSDWQDSGTVISITALPNQGFSFSHWGGGGIGSYTGTNNPATVAMNGSISDTAFFGQAIQITIASEPAGQVIMLDDSSYKAPKPMSWLVGSSHTLATTSPQYDSAQTTRFLFDHWSDSGAISHVIAPTSDSTFTATFTTQYFLKTDAGDGGIVVTSSAWHNKGKRVRILAMPDSGYIFVEWHGAGNGSYSGTNASDSVTMNGPITETAIFGRILPPPTLSGLQNNAEGVSTSPNLD